MTANYTVMHCNTLHYTVEYTATHCSSDNKTRPNNAAGMWSGYCPPEHNVYCIVPCMSCHLFGGRDIWYKMLE